MRQIAERLGLSKSTVQRILDAGRDRLAEAEAERVDQAEALDIAAWLRDQALADHERSLAEAEAARGAGEWRNLPAERKVRTTVRAELARLLGVDPIRREAMELRRKQLDTGADVESTLNEFFGDSPALAPPPELP